MRPQISRSSDPASSIQDFACHIRNVAVIIHNNEVLKPLGRETPIEFDGSRDETVLMHAGRSDAQAALQSGCARGQGGTSGLAQRAAWRGPAPSARLGGSTAAASSRCRTGRDERFIHQARLL
jgi:hypothetical protein